MDKGGYQSLTTAQNDNDEYQPSEIMVHVVPDANKRRWNHVEDLDSFFTRIYYYHQKHGFLCILLQECFELGQFLFVIGFATFLLECVNYPVLFKDVTPNSTINHNKVTIHDAIIPANECISNFGPMMWFSLLIAALFWILRFVYVIYNTILNWEIRAFYRTALGIQDCDLDNLTWYDVQKKLQHVQREQQMCIHKQDLSELDIYHRILRFKNYMIAMTNKGLLPLKYNLPLLGESVFLTHGMKYNLEMLLFWGPWAPFENSWHLREDYKKTAKRKELASSLSKRILWVGIANLALAPVIFLWQILYSFFNYAEVLKRQPGTLGMRRWSLYGRLYLRHFNELEHEINVRLVRAYRPAARYMNIFNSPSLTIIAQNIAFIAGAIFAVLSLLAIYDEDVLTVEHVLLLITVLGAVIAICRAFIPDEQLVWCPEKLLTSVLAHVHYFPDQWKGKAHTSQTRDQFSLLFQYKAVYLLEELISPFITPIILCFYLRPKALEIVDFYRHFTVEVVGVGDVCSFAQMDVRKHGNPTWQTSMHEDASNKPADHYTQAENGKTELSLVHFTHTNPDWRPPNDSGAFIANLKERAARDAINLPTVLEENPLFASLNSLSSMGAEYSTAIASLIRDNQLLNPLNPVLPSMSMSPQPTIVFSNNQQQPPPLQQASFRGHLSRHEGPLYPTHRGITSGLQQSELFGTLPSYNNTLSFAHSFAQPAQGIQKGLAPETTIEANCVEMSLDALYIHELHHMELRRRSLRGQGSGQSHTRGSQPTAGTSTPNIHGQANRGSFSSDDEASEKTRLLLPSSFYGSS